MLNKLCLCGTKNIIMPYKFTNLIIEIIILIVSKQECYFVFILVLINNMKLLWLNSTLF